MKRKVFSAKTIVYTAVMTALVSVSTMALSIRTSISCTNLGDTFIFLTAFLLGPIPSLIAGGIGSFIADLLTYPLTMWFTLFVKGIEGLLAGLLVIAFKKIKFDKKWLTYLMLIISFVIASLFMIGGYFVCNTLFYGNLNLALLALPNDFIQGGLSTVFAVVLCVALEKPLSRILHNKDKKKENEEKIEEDKIEQ